MNNNRASRKGIGAQRSDYDYVTSILRSIGCQFTESTVKPRKHFDEEYDLAGRAQVTCLAFETTRLVFNRKGKYLGRVFMARDECDYVTPATERSR